jgi:hypothetical protein
MHTLVVVSYCLATFGLDGEDLFGANSYLLTMLQTRTDPRITAEVSVNELLGMESGPGCSHDHLSPADLAEKLSENVEQTFSNQARVGWRVFRLILQHAEVA